MSSSSDCNRSTPRQNDSQSLVVSHYRKAIPEKAEQITCINTEVLHTDHVIFELRSQRAALGRKLNAFVPAVNLPPEVLTTIFEFACCSTEDEIFQANIKKYSWDEDPDNAHAGTPLLIAKVCSVWRNIALAAPQIWTNIIIYYEDERDENQAIMLENWLSKSGQRPLDVKLMQQGPLTVIEYTEVIDVLVAYAHRFRTLNLFLPIEWKPALTSITDRVPRLTHLTLHWPADDDDPLFDRVDMFANAPQLREVTLVGYHVAEVSLPWAQLESLESRYRSASECVRTLRSCPRLRRWRISDLRDQTILSTPIAHTALEVLEVSCYDEEPISELLKVLEPPALRSFRLRICGHWMPGWSSWLPSFLARVAGELETLCLPYASPLEEELLVALRAVPKLRKLVLQNPYWLESKKKFTQRALDLLNPNKYEGLGCAEAGQLDGRAGTPGPDESSNRHCLLPNLETLVYEGGIDFTPHALVEFLLARWEGPFVRSELELEPGSQITDEPVPSRPSALQVTRLRSATLKTPILIQFDGADAAVIKRLRLEGMHLEFLKLPRDAAGWDGHGPL